MECGEFLIRPKIYKNLGGIRVLFCKITGVIRALSAVIRAGIEIFQERPYPARIYRGRLSTLHMIDKGRAEHETENSD